MSNYAPSSRLAFIRFWPATHGHIIYGQALGREQKQKIAEEVTDTLERIAHKPKSYTYIAFDELPDENWARATWRQRSSAVKRAVSSANVAVARACVRLCWPTPFGVPRPTLRRCIAGKLLDE